ncbi:PP2C family protein-serine/threonine phosphatase [Pseudanabaena mucicola]|uniref:SpoIIE family protein phosphatase n=1 Tax=Pseudanabaena mucicola FACHB-723 TaxID=2692860 RepID=A0ABR7ZXY1_9CYAN|nr:SpoIIE family protein phosphatase [Pseudanabaena mucicola]MBD2188639.1 SpoIIE family protein phosphatase [Pseudanabaena mucicola FACHB-723]
MTLFKPAIALMNRLKYPQKFFLISLLFVLPLALVMNFLISELDSRIEFTQKESYGNAYLKSINQLWKYVPQRQLLLQRQFYKNSQKSQTSSLSPEIDSLQQKIEQEFEKLTIVDRQLGKEMQATQKLEDVKQKWQILLASKEFLGFRTHDAVLDEINLFRRHVVDVSNLILDPDLDTYYLMDAIAFKLPAMQELLYKVMQSEAEIVFKQEIPNEKKAGMISLISLLSGYNEDLSLNMERAFQNNPRNNLRQSLSMPLRNFRVRVSEINSYSSQLVSQGNDFFLNEASYQQEMESTLADSFILWQKLSNHLDELLLERVQGFKDRKQFIVNFVAVVMAIIIYLFIGFYLSVMRTVQQLDIAARQMTSGGEMSLRLDSKDELSMVVRSFNSVAIALKDSETKYREIFENSVDGIFQTTIDGKYISVNRALARIYGYESVEQMLMAIVDVSSQLYVDPNRRRQFQDLMEANDTITGFESQVYRRDRSTIWISENVRALRNEQGQLLYYEGTVEDISQRKLAELQLEQANQQILALNERLKQENMRMSSELEVTRKLQKMILPKDKELAMITGLDISGFMEPAAEVGGDYYDVLQQNGRIKIGIGDVTGHGLESGMLMIMVQTAVRTLLQNEETDPVRFLDTLNRTIYGNVQRMSSDKNLTLSLIDYEKGRITLSGQHEEMIVVRKDGTLERFDTVDLGFPIGLEEEIEEFLSHKHIHLDAGDVVVLYTDGITEAENESRQLYGVDRLCEVVCQHVHESALAIRHAVIEDLRSHIGTQKIYDDITLLILKQK